MRSNSAEKPNVVLFMVDQLAARWLEVASSSEVISTPHLDWLRENGMTFTQAFTSNPVCCPARATIATGLTTRGHGLLENGYRLDPELPTFMRALQEKDWRTGAFGKLHFRPLYESAYPDYRPYGFDVTHISEDSRGGEWLDWVEEEHSVHYENVLATVWSHVPDFTNYGSKGIDLKSKIEKIRNQFELATEKFPKNNMLAHTLPFPEEISQTAWITARALEFIKETPGEQPFFAQISYVQPHNPFCPPEEYMHFVDVTEIPTPIPAEWVKDPHAPSYFRKRGPSHLDGDHMTKAGLDLEKERVDWRFARQCYFADIVHLDHQLGRVREALEETDRLENTYIIFLSDHGELLGDHGFFFKGGYHYDACIRVPLMIVGPGLQKGSVCREIVQLEDICPTILEMTNTSLPLMPKMNKIHPDQIPILPGRSLLGLCRGEQSDHWRQAAYIESYSLMDPGDWARTIRTNRYRYTFYPKGNGEQMFDIQNDPDEQANIVSDPKYAKLRQDLRDMLLELIVMQDYPKTRRELFALGAP